MGEINVAAASANRLRAKKEEGTASIPAEKTTMDETEKEKLTSGLSTGKAAKGGGAGMPKPQAGEDMLTPAYRERVRQWREAERSGKKDAVGGLLKQRQAEAKGAY